MKVEQTQAALAQAIRNLQDEAWGAVEEWMLDQSAERLARIAELRSTIELLQWAETTVPMAFDKDGWPVESDRA